MVVLVLFGKVCVYGTDDFGLTTRLALVASQSNNTVEQLLTLATAKLSNVDGIVLLERQEIRRLLEEHKLTLSGLVDADQAIMLGKLLPVEVFAVVELDTEDERALGIVVFDAQSGLRLLDRALPGSGGDATVEDIVKGVKTAIAKFHRSTNDTQSICLLTVRNLDLPRDLDGFCHAVGMLFEKQLTGSPDIKVLERKRLEHINKERALSNKEFANNLLTSLAIIELEIGRGQNEAGYRVTAFLSDSAGRTLGKCEYEALKAGNLSTTLSQKVIEFLQKKPVTLPINRTLEANRFLSEANFRLGHKNFAYALAAAESAYALNPDAQRIQHQLANCLVIRGLAVLDPKADWFANLPKNSNLSSNDLKLALKLFIRGLEIHYEIHKQYHLDNINTMTDRHNFFRSLNLNEGYAIKNVTHSIKHNTDSEVCQLYDQLQQIRSDINYQHTEDLAALAEKDPRVFVHYTQAVSNRPKVMNRWARVAKSTPLNHFSYRGIEKLASYLRSSVYNLGENSDINDDDILELKQKLELLKRLNPVATLRIQSGQINTESKAGKLSSKEKLVHIRELWQQAQHVMDNLADNQPTWKDKEDRRLCYDAIDNAFGKGVWWCDSPENFDFWLDFCEQMGNRGDISHEITWRMKKQIDLFQQGYPRLITIVDNFLNLLDLPNCRVINGSKNVIRTSLSEAKETISKAKPSLVKHKAETPWDKIRVLIDLEKHDGLIWVYLPVLHDRFVYTAGLRKTDKSFFLEVLRVSLDLAQVEIVNKASFDPTGRWDYPNKSISDLKYHRGIVYVATKHAGIYIFPTDGSPVQQINQASGLPSNSVSAIACLADTLYAKVGDAMGAYLVAVDLSKGNTKVLASSQRTQKLSPFDDSPAFVIKYMVPDTERSRVLMMVNSPEVVAGFWALDIKTGQFHRSANLQNPFNHPFKWGSPVRKDHILLGAYNWIFKYDLESDSVSWIYGNRGYDSDPYRQHKRNLIKGEFNMWPPYLLLDGYLWSSEPFSRISIKNQKQELFTQLPNPNRYSLHGGCLEVVPETKEILYGHRDGLWLLSLQVGD